MKGQIATPSLMKAVLDANYGLRTGRVICQVVLMEIPRDHRRFLMADTGITVQPSLEDKADILRSSVECRARPRRRPAARGTRGRNRDSQSGHAGNCRRPRTDPPS